MSPVTTCPDRADLSRLLLGRLAASEEEQLARHLEMCAHCAAVVKALPAVDTLHEADRLPQPKPPDAAKVDSDTLGTALRAPKQDAVLPPPTSFRVELGAAERFDFLAPPQGPGELGRLGAYRVLKVLGSGGMGVVFLAEDIHLKRQTALKVMKPEAAGKSGARERFLREAQAAAVLEHDNIVTIFQVGEERGVPFLAMQWLKGMSLEERLNRPEPLTLPQILRLGQQMARGLAMAHENGLIHRDIKPANLWIEPENDGRIKILDFGLARAVADDVKLTKSGMIVGTPAFMAPEQARGEKVDPRCDLFSLGVVFYRMSTGQMPFRGENTMALLSALILDTPPAPQFVNVHLPAALSELVMQLLAKKPEDRPASARVVAERLQKIERELTTSPPLASAATQELALSAVGPARRAAPIPRRRLLAVVVALLVLLPSGYFYGGTLIQKFTSTHGDKEEPFNAPLELAKAKPPDVKPVNPVVKQAIPAVKPDPSAERKAAEWVLSIGGTVGIRVGNQEIGIPLAKDLPTDPIHVVSVDLRAIQQVNDAGLEHLKSLTNLTFLNLENTPMDDTGLAHLKTLTNLAFLGLGGTKISDAGLVHIKKLTNLTRLNLQNTAVSNAGLSHLETLTNLQGLFLCDTAVSDIGLEHLKKLSNLKDLNLCRTQVSNAGLEQLKTLTNLKQLVLTGTQVSDAGLEQLKTMTNLRKLYLGYMMVSDAGLEQIKTLTNLTYLGLDITAVSDAGLEHLQTLTNLTDLSLFGTAVSDAGLVHLKTLTNLTSLNLNDTKMSDAGLEHLKTLTNLRQLWLKNTKVTAAGVDGLRKALPKCQIDSDFPEKK